jgi:hypothetical protein
MVLLMKVDKESKSTISFWFVFNLYASVRSNIKLLFKQKNVDSENYTTYKNFYNKQAKKKEQTNLLIT